MWAAVKSRTSLASYHQLSSYHHPMNVPCRLSSFPQSPLWWGSWQTSHGRIRIVTIPEDDLRNLVSQYGRVSFVSRLMGRRVALFLWTCNLACLLALIHFLYVSLDRDEVISLLAVWASADIWTILWIILWVPCSLAVIVRVFVDASRTPYCQLGPTRERTTAYSSFWNNPGHKSTTPWYRVYNQLVPHSVPAAYFLQFGHSNLEASLSPHPVHLIILLQ